MHLVFQIYINIQLCERILGLLNFRFFTTLIHVRNISRTVFSCLLICVSFLPVACLCFFIFLCYLPLPATSWLPTCVSNLLFFLSFAISYPTVLLTYNLPVSCFSYLSFTNYLTVLLTYHSPIT